MTEFLDIIISSVISTVAIIVTIVSLLESRKRTKLLEKMAKAPPDTTATKRKTRKPTEKQGAAKTLSKVRSDDLKRMKLEEDKAKFEWQKKRILRKG